MGKRQKNSKHNSRHHIIPSSRGGTSRLENLADVGRSEHQYYHALFINRTPVEIVQYLTDTFWKGNWDYVRNAYNQYGKDNTPL